MDGEQYFLNNRRLRVSPKTRELVRDVLVSRDALVQPLFVVDELTEPQPVDHMPGVYRETSESVLRRIETDIEKKQTKFLLFFVPGSKASTNFGSVFDRAFSKIAAIRKRFGDDVWLASDVCLCSSTEHGHCGVLNEKKDFVQNHQSIEVLRNYALSFAQAGVDCVAPSDMMDGRIKAIRNSLNHQGFENVLLWSYAVKFHSSYYGPFRAAADSAPQKLNKNLENRATYQLDPFAKKVALQCAQRDFEEGADILMVKPGMAYLDIISELTQKIPCPWSVYQVSGEYAAIELLAKNGLANRERAHLEAWGAFARAGAKIIVTYAARDANQILDAQSWY